MAPFDLGHGAVPYLYLTELKLKAVFPILAKSFFISDSCYIQSFSADFGQRESRLNSMPGKCCFSVFFFPFVWSGLWNISFPSHCPTLERWALLNILFICVTLLSMVLTWSHVYWCSAPKYTCTDLFYTTRTRVCAGAVCLVKLLHWNHSIYFLNSYFCSSLSPSRLHHHSGVEGSKTLTCCVKSLDFLCNTF